MCYPDNRWISHPGDPNIPDIRNWTDPFYLTGMSSGGRNIWRLTPDLSFFGMSVRDFMIADSPPTFAIGT